MQRLVQTDDRSTCPFKGEARYFVHAVKNPKTTKKPKKPKKPKNPKGK
jgi:uncharacterized protein (DUF427 family)